MVRSQTSGESEEGFQEFLAELKLRTEMERKARLGYRLTKMQTAVLELVVGRPGMRSADLSNVYVSERSAVSGCLRRMGKRGFVYREKLQYYPTEKGAHALRVRLYRLSRETPKKIPKTQMEVFWEKFWEKREESKD